MGSGTITFMPYDSDNLDTTELLGNLASMVQTVEKFIEFYNSGLINRNNDDVVVIADNVVGAYKNLEKKSGKIVFLSEEEIKLSELLEKLTPWSGLVVLKRLAQEGLNEGTFTSDTELVLDESGVISFKKFDSTGETVEEKLTSDRLKKDVVQAIHDSGQSLNIGELSDLDTSFISELYEIV